MSDLRVVGLGKRYGSTVALDHVDLDIPAGSRTAVVGPSGSGKTTFLRLVAGFEDPDVGLIHLGGSSLFGGRTNVPVHRRGIGYVTQEGALFPHLSVAANIGFGLPSDAPARATRVADLLHLVGLPQSIAERRPHELSGGQQQRVAVARALARSPRLMLLDEPFSALDAGLRDAMRGMVTEILAAAAITTILVTPDQAEALSFADQLAVLRDGRLVQAGPPQDLYQRPADPQTARFLGDALILPATVENGVAHTRLGAVRAAAAAGRRLVMLRPEQVQVIAAGGTRLGPNGRIVSRTYHGSLWRVVVALTPDQSGGNGEPEETERLTLTLPGAEPLSPGAPVEFRLNGLAHVFDCQKRPASIGRPGPATLGRLGLGGSPGARPGGRRMRRPRTP